MNNLQYATGDSSMHEDSPVYRNYLVPENKPETAADILNITSLASYGRGAIVYPIWGVSIDRRTVSVCVYKEDGLWFAEIPWLNIFGEGDSPAVAIDDAKAHVQYFYDFYSSSSEDELIGLALILKERYSHVDL